MGSSIRIINASPENIDEIFEIETESFTCPWTRSNFVSAFSAGNTEIFALQSDEGSILGFACLLIIDYEAEILNIAVRQNYRKNGYGKMLLDHALEICVLRGISSVFLEVRESNVSARSLYDKAGFEVIGIRKKYYVSPVEDAILMMKTI